MVSAPTTSIVIARHIHYQVGLPRIVANVLAQSIVHQNPVVLVARGPDLPASRTRIFLCALRHLQTVGYLYQSAGRVTGDRYNRSCTIYRAAGRACHYRVVGGGVSVGLRL